MELREPAAAYGKKKLSIAEYLDYEDRSADKYEYYQGQIFAMAGTKVPHNIIARNLLCLLEQALRGKNCQPFGSDQRIHIPENTLFTYPDISIVCGPIITLNNDNWNILNPSVIIEVLSTASRDYDRGSKFKLYRKIGSLKEFIVVDSLCLGIEAYRLNQQERWQLEEYADTDQVLSVEAIGIGLPVRSIYEGVGLNEKLSTYY